MFRVKYQVVGGGRITFWGKTYYTLPSPHPTIIGQVYFRVKCIMFYKTPHHTFYLRYTKLTQLFLLQHHAFLRRSGGNVRQI